MKVTRWLVAGVLGVGFTCLPLAAQAFPSAGAATTTSGHQGRVFYVSPHGNDSSSGLSTAHAFKTIHRCSQVMTAGDTCLLMSGTYRETVAPTRSGTAARPITYAAYPGASVTVDGADPVAQWHQVSKGNLAVLSKSDRFLANSGFGVAVRAGHIYRASVTPNPSLPGIQVFFRGRALVEGQWPYPGTDPLTPVVQIAKAGTTDTQIADPALKQPAGYWDGASVYTEYWFISQTGTVASSTPGHVSLTNMPDSGTCVGLLANNTRYYLFGQLKMLTHPGEWIYDSAQHMLYVWAPTGHQPATGSVEVQQRAQAFDLSRVSYTKVVGLHLFAASAMTGGLSTGDVIDKVVANYVSGYQTLSPDPNQVKTDVCSILTAGETTSGLVIRGTGNVVENSTIAYSSGNGIALLGRGNRVVNNVIHDVDSMGSYAAGVNVTGPNQAVLHNTIYRAGRSGITVDWHVNGFRSYDNRFAYNDVSQFGRLNLDSAAMYVCCYLDMSGTSVDHNWLHDPTPLKGVDPWAEAGFYTDTFSRNVLAYDNVTWRTFVNNSGPGTPEDLVPVGFFINGGGGNRFYNNDGPVQGAYHPKDPNIVENNIGTVYRQPPKPPESGIDHNLPSNVNPQFVNPARDDYRLMATSPARGAGVYVPGITVGGTDKRPSMGAYQYGAPFWRAGADSVTGN